MELDVALALISLYDRTGETKLAEDGIHHLFVGKADAYAALDRDKGFARSEQLVQELFNEKSLAYAASDLAAIERYHTVLGLIYASRERWTSDWADNATFQLSHAIDASRALAKQTGAPPPPLPELQSLLATGYEARNRRSDAAAQRLEAAAGFLDLDAVPQATAELEHCAALDCAAAPLAGLRQITSTRARVRSGEELSLDQNAKGDSGPAVDAWIDSGAVGGLDASFVRRQQFKVLADAGEHAGSAGDLAAASTLRVKALEAIREQPSLPSLDDVARVRKIESAFSSEIKVGGERGVVQLDATPAEMETAKVWTVGSAQGPRKFVVSKDLFVAGKILEQPAVAEAVRQGELSVAVDKGEVNVKPTMATAAVTDIAAAEKNATEIRKIKGVRSVKVTEVAKAAATEVPPPW